MQGRNPPKEDKRIPAKFCMLRGNVISCLLGRPTPIIEWRIGADTEVDLLGKCVLVTNMFVLGKDIQKPEDHSSKINQAFALRLSFDNSRLAQEWAKGIMLHSIALLDGNNQQSKIKPAQPVGPRCEFCGQAATMASQLAQTGAGPALTLCTACCWLWYKYPQRLHERKSTSDELIELAKNHCWEDLKAALRQMPSFINYKPPYRNYYILHHIAYFGALDMVRWLKACLPNVDWTVTTNNGQTASQVAELQHKYTAALLHKFEQESTNEGAHTATAAAVPEESTNEGARTATAAAVPEPPVEDVRALFQRINLTNSDGTDTDRERPAACSMCFATTSRQNDSNSCMMCHSIVCAKHMIRVDALNLEYHGWMAHMPKPRGWHICLRCYNENWWLNRPSNREDISVKLVNKGALPGWFRVQFVWERWDRAKWVVAIPKFTVQALLRRMDLECVSKFKQLISQHSRPQHCRPAAESPDRPSSLEPISEAIAVMTRQNSLNQRSFLNSPTMRQNSLTERLLQSQRPISVRTRQNSLNQRSLLKSPRINTESPRGGIDRMLSKVNFNERLVQAVVKLCLSPDCVDLCRRFIPVPPVWDEIEELFKGNAKFKVPEAEVRFIDLLVEFLASEQVWICQLHCVLYRLEQSAHNESLTGERRTLWFLAALTDAVQNILKEHRRMHRWMRAELTQMRCRRMRKSSSAVITRAMVIQVRTQTLPDAQHTPCCHLREKP